MNEELLNVGLPKWPQMVVWGESITTKQAYDIIMRTDSFLCDFSEYSGGNNREWNKWAKQTLGIASAMDMLERLYENPADRHQKQWQLDDRFKALAGIVSTSYVTNNWASSAFIFGPHGWCHPDGTIGFSDNVGKWPSVQDVLEDWQHIAAAFPYLNLTATLMSGESCEEDTVPLVSIRVNNGKATLSNPVLPEEPVEQRNIANSFAGFGSYRREQGLPDEWIILRGTQLAPILDQAFNEAVGQLHPEKTA